MRDVTRYPARGEAAMEADRHEPKNRIHFPSSFVTFVTVFKINRPVDLLIRNPVVRAARARLYFIAYLPRASHLPTICLHLCGLSASICPDLPSARTQHSLARGRSRADRRPAPRHSSVQRRITAAPSRRGGRPGRRRRRGGGGGGSPR